MPDEPARLFFPQLQRVGGYPIKSDGSHYGYAYYREYIRIDCQRRCVYCDSHETEIGGAEAMQLDHFRPEALFVALINDPLNLHYGCARCNLLKSKHWPAGQANYCHDGETGFIDPFAEDRAEYFKVGDDGTLSALRPPAKYLIGLLHLQREHLRKLRLRRLLLADFEVQIDRVKAEAEADLEAGRQTDSRRVIELCETLQRIKQGFSFAE
jgi:hypothetical protein